MGRIRDGSGGMGVAFLDRLGEHGARPALLFADGLVLSYGALADRIAACLADWGQERRLILWEASPDADAIVAYLAALAGGHPVMPVSPCETPAAGASREALIATYRPDCILGGGPPVHLPPVHSPPDAYHPDLALLLSTSGSTGSAKLVRLSAASIGSNAMAIATYLRLTPADRSALILPLHYSYGLSVLHAHLAVGASVFVSAQSILAPGFIDMLRAMGCTNLSGVPHSFALLEQIGFRNRSLPSMRFLTVAGGRMAPDMVMRYAQHMAAREGAFFVMYGQTEATARMAYLPPEAALQHPDCIGRAIPGGALRLVDDSGTDIIEPGEIGELVYRGANVMLGYAECRADLARGRDIRELSTGDLAVREPAGFFRLVGRRRRFSKIAGLRLAHDAIEMALERIGIASAVSGDDRHLFIALGDAAAIDAARACVLRLTGLPASCLKCRFFADLPRGTGGKIDYRALVASFDDTAAAIAADARVPAVAAAFADIFAPRRVGAYDSFASLGGDSLSYVELSLALKESLDPLPSGWEQLSVGDLTDLAARNVPAKPRRGILARASIETDLFLRAAAILLVVLHHATLWPMAGGAAILLVLIGNNLARHHARRLFVGDSLGMLRACARPILLYYPLLLALCLALGSFPWQSLLLVGNLGLGGYAPQHSPLVTFWFVEAYMQILMLTAALFAVPQLRRFVARQPFAAGLVGLAGAVALRSLADQWVDLGELRYFFTPRILYVAVLGWCLYYADTLRRKILMVLIVCALLVGLPVVEDSMVTTVWVRAALLMAASLLLLFCTRFYLPVFLGRLLSHVAVASFSIYLFHTLPYFSWLHRADFPGASGPIIYIALGLASGLAAHGLLHRLGRWGRLGAGALRLRLERS